MTTTIHHFNMFRLMRNILTKCSFCDRFGHDVLGCNDPQLTLMEDMLFREKENLMADNDMTNADRKMWMNFFICRKTQLSIHSLNRWRSFAIRKCGYNNNYADHLNIWIDKIVEYVFNNERPLVQSIFNSEFIAFDENDVVGYLTDNLIQYAYQNNNIDRKINIKIDLNLPSCDENKVCECGICYEEKKESSFVKLDCSHEFCGECFENVLKLKDPRNPVSCSMCRNVIKKINLKDETIKTNLEAFIVST